MRQKCGDILLRILSIEVTETVDTSSTKIDQLRYIVECFSAEMSARRAIISMGDVMKDDFDTESCLEKTLDILCTRELHFIK